VLILAVILAALSLLIWIVLTFFRGVFWQLQAFSGDAPAGGPAQRSPRVVAIVPARNESETIARCVASLLDQNYAGEFHVIVVDDHSDDCTAAQAQSVAHSPSGSTRVAVLPATALPSGWTGKLWALQQGLTASASFSPDYLWFTDADIVHAPDTLQRLVSRAARQELDLTSLMVLLNARTIPERLLIPPFLYFFLMLYPPKWIADPQAKTAGAAGGCILLRRDALDRIGGIASLRNQVIDDCALARAVKRTGGKVWMGLTRQSVSLRAYATLAQIRDLIARTAFTQLRYSPLLLFATVLGMLLTYVAPVILSFHTAPVVWLISLTAWVLMTLTFLPAVRFYRLLPFWALLLPVAALFYSYATCLSAARYWMGLGGQWKGRAQARP